MMDIYALKINKIINKQDFDRLLLCISEEKREKILRFHKYEDAQRSLIADILLRNIICNKMGLRNKNIKFEFNQYGKPSLSIPSCFKFNVSHSGSWVVCATASEDVGIDVEQILPIDISFAQKYFSKYEHNDLSSKNINERLTYFYELWTCKESFIKAIGMGLSFPLNSFSVKFINNEISIETENQNCNCFLKQYNIDKNYKMAVCNFSNNYPENVEIIEMDSIFSIYYK